MSRPVGFVTIVGTVYHQLIDQQPHGEPRSYNIPLRSMDQPFERRILLTEEPKTLKELGCWLDDCSLITVHNETGSMMHRVPTVDQQADISSAVVQVDAVLVRPGRDCRFEPVSFDAILLRCLKGKATIKLVVYPV